MFSRKKEEGVELIAKADLDPGKYERYMQGLRDRQNFGAGLLGGIAAYAGFRWSARKLTQDDYAKISQMP